APLDPEFGVNPLAISPDGRTIVYTAQAGQSSRLYVRSLGELRTRPLPGTDGAQAPFFSPDGAWVGFWDHAHRLLKRVPLSGGLPLTIVSLSQFGGAVWGPGDILVVGTER